MEHTLEQVGKFKLLRRDGNGCYCPFAISRSSSVAKQEIPQGEVIQGSRPPMPQMVSESMNMFVNCGSHCAMFNIKKLGNGLQDVELRCGSGHVPPTYRITETGTQAPDLSSNHLKVNAE